jgi:hypothetical protein
MGTLEVSMLRTAMEAFAGDLDPAFKVPTMDDPLVGSTATHPSPSNSPTIPAALDWGLYMNMAARALERVGRQRCRHR